MRYYAGLDVSLAKTSVCVIDEDGKIKRRTFSERVRELTADLPSVAAILRAVAGARGDAALTRPAQSHGAGDRREHAVCRCLMTMPGVGGIVGLTFIAAIEDPARFA